MIPVKLQNLVRQSSKLHSRMQSGAKPSKNKKTGCVIGNPVYYSPFTHPAAGRERFFHVLRRMRECGYISPKEYHKYIGQKIRLTRPEFGDNAPYEFNPTEGGETFSGSISTFIYCGFTDRNHLGS